MFAAGIVLFNPDPDFVRLNVKALLEDVSIVFLVDNSSTDNSACFSSFGNQVVYIPNYSNKGIARALNQIMEASQKAGADWVLTLDQDTEIPNQMASRLFNARPKNDENLGIICPSFLEVNSGSHYCKAGFVDECITSGSLTSVEAWSRTHGFDEWMFIDLVDYEFCDQLKSNGFLIYRTAQVEMRHSIGKTTVVRILGHEFRNMNHSAFRKFYQARNRPYLLVKRNEFSYTETLLHSFAMILKVLLFEGQKKSKCHAIVAGTSEGLAKVKELHNDACVQ